MPSIKEKQRKTRAGCCPLVPLETPLSLFLLFYSGCFCVHPKCTQRVRVLVRLVLVHWWSCLSASKFPFSPCPVSPAKKVTYPVSRAVGEPPLCLHSKHSCLFLWEQSNFTASCSQQMQTNTPVHFQGLLQTPSQSKEVAGGSPCGTGQRGLFRRRRLGGCRAGTIWQVGGEGWAQTLKWLVLPLVHSWCEQ